MTSTVGKIAIVTGANQGIGYEIVRLLKPALGASSRVVLCSRDATRGQQAIASLAAQGVEAELGILEITDRHSIDTFAQWARDHLGRVDILINNAGFAFKSAATEPFDVQARVSIDVNYYGTLNVTKALVPLMPPGSRIINVSSTAGLLKIVSPELQARFTAPDLTEESLSTLLEEFVTLTKTNQHREAGWPGSAYGTSKVGMSALSRIHARTLAANGISVNALCPGWCRTNMAGDRAPRSAEDGARTPVWLAVTDGLGTGKFWADEQERTW